MTDDKIHVLCEGDREDKSENTRTQNYVSKEAVDGHILRRVVKEGRDEVLVVRDRSRRLALGTTEYTQVESVSDLHCACGEHFDSHEEARLHIVEQKIRHSDEAEWSNLRVVAESAVEQNPKAIESGEVAGYLAGWVAAKTGLPTDLADIAVDTALD